MGVSEFQEGQSVQLGQRLGTQNGVVFEARRLECAERSRCRRHETGECALGEFAGRHAELSERGRARENLSHGRLDGVVLQQEHVRKADFNALNLPAKA